MHFIKRNKLSFLMPILVIFVILTLDAESRLVWRLLIINKLYNIPARKINEVYNHFTDPIIDKNLPKNFYVVNLDRSPERLALVRERAKKFDIDIKRHQASDGYFITFISKKNGQKFLGNELKTDPNLLKHLEEYEVYCPPNEFPGKPDLIYKHAYKENLLIPDFAVLSAGTMGNCCSMNRLWQKIAQAPNDQIAIIFEDDILMHDNFKIQLDKILKELPDKWDMIYLDYLTVYDHNLNELKTHHEKALVKYPDYGKEAWGAHAYVINRNSARKLLEIQAEKSNIPVDNILMEGVLTGKLNTYVSTVKMADQNPSLESDISDMGRR